MREERRVTKKFRVEDARLIYKNFKGAADAFNTEGNRNFGVLLPPDLADELIEDGWRVKRLRPAEDDPDRFEQPWIKVKVKFSRFKDRNTGEDIETPIIFLVDSRGKMRLSEDMVDQLDWTIIKYCDLVVRPYNYPARPGVPAGVAAYLEELYVEVDEEASARRSVSFRNKYQDVPEIGGK